MVKTCSKCKVEQPEENFYFTNSPTPRRSSWCKECGKRCMTIRRHRNMAAGLCYCGRPRVEGQKRCVLCVTDYQRNRERRLRSGKKNLQKTREEVISAYGGKCACCGESERAFLQFHHVNGGGTKHRKELGGNSVTMWWIRRNNYPDMLQLLCANCHNAITTQGFCPHSQKVQGVAA